MLLWDADDVALTPDEAALFLAMHAHDKPTGVSDEEFLRYTLYWDGCLDPRALPGWVVARHDQHFAYLESPEGQAQMQAGRDAFLAIVQENARATI